MAFTLGIILPLAGIFGFFTGKYSNLMSLLGMGPMVDDPTLFFTLFDVRGVGVMQPYLNLTDPIWTAIEVFSIFMLLSGIIALFSVIYTSFSDTRNLLTSWILRKIVPGLAVFFMAFQWILFGIAFALETPQPTISIDPTGLTLSIIAMTLLLLAINRDYIFRGVQESEVKNSEVSK
jgi:hypothetical protein